MNTPRWLAGLDIESPSMPRAEIDHAVRDRYGCRPSAFALAVALHTATALAIVLMPPALPTRQEVQVVDLVSMPAAAATAEHSAPSAPPAAAPAEDPPPTKTQSAKTQSAKTEPRPVAKLHDRPRPPSSPQTVTAAVSAVETAGIGTAPAPETAEAAPHSGLAGEMAAAFEPPRGQAGYLNNPAPTYPRVARKAGWQGLVRLLVDVAEDGRVVTVTIRRSSGFEVLDDSALAAVRDWKFRPATRGGVPIAASVEVPIRFSLSQGG